MRYKYDLHLHSKLSDGDYPIEKVVSLAKKNGLRVISITDHNVWLDFFEKNRLALSKKIVNIPGVEISTKFQDCEVHVLGYAQKFRLSVLKSGLRKTIAGYNERAKLIVSKLGEMGLAKLDYKLIKKKKGANLPITKYDIAKWAYPLCRIPVNDLQRMFSRKDSGCYVPYGNWAMNPEEAVKLIHKAGGIAVLAHPGEIIGKLIRTFGIKRGKRDFDRLVAVLLENKIDGIEINSSKNNPQIKKYCLKIAKQKKLLIVGGSDWHGEKHHPEIAMGQGGLTKKQLSLFYKALGMKL